MYSLDGQESYRGAATVHSLERRMDGEVQKVYLTIYAPIANRSYRWLKGDYVEKGSNRSGPFIQIEAPEEEDDDLV